MSTCQNPNEQKHLRANKHLLHRWFSYWSSAILSKSAPINHLNECANYIAVTSCNFSFSCAFLFGSFGWVFGCGAKAIEHRNTDERMNVRHFQSCMAHEICALDHMQRHLNRNRLFTVMRMLNHERIQTNLAFWCFVSISKKKSILYKKWSFSMIPHKVLKWALLIGRSSFHIN